MIKILACIITVLFGTNSLFVPISFSQVTFLPPAGSMVGMTAKYNPILIKGIHLHPENPFKFDFIVDVGDTHLSQDEMKDEGQKLIGYFLASLTTPEKEMWVNLSPFEKDRIIPKAFGDTEMGKALLSQDYILKQIMATALYPERDLGRKFWQKIYAQAQAKFGTTNVPVNTFNKVWILPDKAEVFENSKSNSVFVVKSTLKVMLEQDYLSMKKHSVPSIPSNPVILSEAKDLKVPYDSSSTPQNDVSKLGSQIIKEIVIPALEREVNEGKNFALLRQVYQSLILAAWYKKNLKDNVIAKAYVDRNKTKGVDVMDKQITQKIYRQYLQAYRKGVFNFIKDDIDAASQNLIPRKYFSGGLRMVVALKVDEAMGAADARKLAAAMDDGRVVEIIGGADTEGGINKAMATPQSPGLEILPEATDDDIELTETEGLDAARELVIAEGGAQQIHGSLQERLKEREGERIQIKIDEQYIRAFIKGLEEQVAALTVLEPTAWNRPLIAEPFLHANPTKKDLRREEISRQVRARQVELSRQAEAERLEKVKLLQLKAEIVTSILRMTQKHQFVQDRSAELLLRITDMGEGITDEGKMARIRTFRSTKDGELITMVKEFEDFYASLVKLGVDIINAASIEDVIRINSGKKNWTGDLKAFFDGLDLEIDQFQRDIDAQASVGSVLPFFTEPVASTVKGISEDIFKPEAVVDRPDIKERLDEELQADALSGLAVLEERTTESPKSVYKIKAGSVEALKGEYAKTLREIENLEQKMQAVLQYLRIFNASVPIGIENTTMEFLEQKLEEVRSAKNEIISIRGMHDNFWAYIENNVTDIGWNDFKLHRGFGEIYDQYVQMINLKSKADALIKDTKAFDGVIDDIKHSSVPPAQENPVDRSFKDKLAELLQAGDKLGYIAEVERQMDSIEHLMQAFELSFPWLQSNNFFAPEYGRYQAYLNEKGYLEGIRNGLGRIKNQIEHVRSHQDADDFNREFDALLSELHAFQSPYWNPLRQNSYVVTTPVDFLEHTRYDLEEFLGKSLAANVPQIDEEIGEWIQLLGHYTDLKTADAQQQIEKLRQVRELFESSVRVLNEVPYDQPQVYRQKLAELGKLITWHRAKLSVYMNWKLEQLELQAHPEIAAEQKLNLMDRMIQLTDKRSTVNESYAALMEKSGDLKNKILRIMAIYQSLPAHPDSERLSKDIGDLEQREDIVRQSFRVFEKFVGNINVLSEDSEKTVRSIVQGREIRLVRLMRLISELEAHIESVSRSIDAILNVSLPEVNEEDADNPFVLLNALSQEARDGTDPDRQFAKILKYLEAMLNQVNLTRNLLGRFSQLDRRYISRGHNALDFINEINANLNGMEGFIRNYYSDLKKRAQTELEDDEKKTILYQNAIYVLGYLNGPQPPGYRRVSIDRTRVFTNILSLPQWISITKVDLENQIGFMILSYFSKSAQTDMRIWGDAYHQYGQLLEEEGLGKEMEILERTARFIQINMSDFWGTRREGIQDIKVHSVKLNRLLKIFDWYFNQFMAYQVWNIGQLKALADAKAEEERRLTQNMTEARKSYAEALSGKEYILGLVDTYEVRDGRRVSLRVYSPGDKIPPGAKLYREGRLDSLINDLEQIRRNPRQHFLRSQEIARSGWDMEQFLGFIDQELRMLKSKRESIVNYLNVMNSHLYSMGSYLDHKKSTLSADDSNAFKREHELFVNFYSAVNIVMGVVRDTQNPKVFSDYISRSGEYFSALLTGFKNPLSWVKLQYGNIVSGIQNLGRQKEGIRDIESSLPVWNNFSPDFDLLEGEGNEELLGHRAYLDKRIRIASGLIEEIDGVINLSGSFLATPNARLFTKYLKLYRESQSNKDKYYSAAEYVRHLRRLRNALEEDKGYLMGQYEIIENIIQEIFQLRDLIKKNTALGLMPIASESLWLDINKKYTELTIRFEEPSRYVKTVFTEAVNEAQMLMNVPKPKGKKKTRRTEGSQPRWSLGKLLERARPERNPDNYSDEDIVGMLDLSKRSLQAQGTKIRGLQEGLNEILSFKDERYFEILSRYYRLNYVMTVEEYKGDIHTTMGKVEFYEGRIRHLLEQAERVDVKDKHSVLALNEEVNDVIGYFRQVSSLIDIVKHGFEKPQQDRAMKGGIDLNRVDVKVGGGGVRTAFNDPAQLKMLMDASGLKPVIYKIQPMTAPLMNTLLGFNLNSNTVGTS